jgi:signal peptidase I
MTEQVSGTGVRYPLLAMWIWPQATIRDVITRANPVPPLILSALVGMYIAAAVTVFLAPGAGIAVPFSVILGIGALAGIAGLYLCALLFWLAGKLIGGRATLREMWRALGWLAIPNTLAINLAAALWLLLYTVASMMRAIADTDDRQAILATTMILAAPLGLWSFVISIRALGAVLKVGFLRALACLILVAAGTGLAAMPFAGLLDRAPQSVVVPSSGMFPTLGILERHLLNPSADLARGDIVAYHRMQNHPHYGIVSRLYIKRVIGLPGDVVAMSQGVLSLNGESVKRERLPDLPSSPASGQRPLHFQETLPGGVTYGVVDSDEQRTLGNASHRVGPDQLFLIGDNRDADASEDIPDTYQGRPTPAHHGLVWRDRVIGKVAR